MGEFLSSLMLCNLELRSLAAIGGVIFPLIKKKLKGKNSVEVVWVRMRLFFALKVFYR